MKKYLATILVIVLISLPSVVTAEQVGGDIKDSIDDYKNEQDQSFYGILGEKTNEYYSDYENRPSYGERFTAGIIISFSNWVLKALGMIDVSILVFGKAPAEDSGSDFLIGDIDSREGMVYGTFPEPLFDAIAFFYDGFVRLFPIPIVIGFSLFGIYLMLNGGTEQGRSKTKDYAMSFVIAITSLYFAPYLWKFAFGLNTMFIDFIWYMMEEYGVRLGLFLDMIWGNGTDAYNSFISFQGLGIAILVFFAAIMTAILNYQYALRMILLSVLIIGFPVAASLSVFPRFRHSLTTWWQEFIANVFVQTAHAIALGLFFASLYLSGKNELSFWIVFAYFFALPTVVMVFRRIIGLQEGNSFMGSMGAMMGVMALMNTARAFRANKGGNTKNIDSAPQSDNTSAVGGGRSPLLEQKGLANRAINNKWTRGAAMTVATGAGAIMSTMATGNPVLGAAAGSVAGQAMSSGLGKIGQVADNAKSFIRDMKDLKSIGAGTMGAVKQTMQQRYVSGQGGAINNTLVRAGWFGQQMADKFNNTTSPRQSFIQSQQKQYDTATQNMEQIEPQLALAKDHYQEMKSRYGKGSEWYERNQDPQTKKILMPDEYVKAEQNYNRVNADYLKHKQVAMNAKMNLTDHGRMVESMQPLQQKGKFTSGRGRI